MAQIWLEIAVNGGATRMRQPLIPVTVAEIVEDGVACAHEGAAIIHLHAYDPATGRQTADVDTYARIIEGIRSRVDVIVYPTVELGTPDAAGLTGVGSWRYATLEALARRGLLEWAVVDPGSTTLSNLRPQAPGAMNLVYLNPPSDIRAGLQLAAAFGFHPSYAIYEPGFVRLGAALAAEQVGLKSPIYRFMFSEGLSFGFPPRRYALDAYLELLRECAPAAPWMIAGLEVDVLPLIPHGVGCGGHVRVGLEDAPLGCTRTNVDLTSSAATAILQAGGTLASAAEVRRQLAAGS
jgi:uncharacterized protein (DUF849 family)